MSHLLLIGFLYLIHPVADTAPKVFSVDIVAPDQTQKLPIPEPLPPVKKISPLVKQRPVPFRKEQTPQTLYGKEDVNSKKGSTVPENSKALSKTKDPASDGENKSGLFPPGEQKPSQSGKDNNSLAPYSYLFDKGTIEKFAREGSPAKKGLTFDTSEFKNRGYMRMLKERVEDIWKYPKEAARKGLSGDLYMKFTIKKDGRLGEVELLRTSGHRELDEAAMNAIKKAAPFWPLPDDWDKDALEIKGHFIYIFGDTLVM